MATRTPPSLPFPENFPKGISVGGIMFAILVLIGIVGLFSSFYQVPANSLGVVQRFGAFHGITEPGLQFKLPFSIDTVSLVEVRRQHKLEFGFSTPGATNVFQAAYDRGEQEIERNMVTGDQNAAVVEWVVQYQISDPKSYLFNFREPEKTLRDLSEAVMREVVGDLVHQLQLGVEHVAKRPRQLLEDHEPVHDSEVAARRHGVAVRAPVAGVGREVAEVEG